MLLEEMKKNYFGKFLLILAFALLLSGFLLNYLINFDKNSNIDNIQNNDNSQSDNNQDNDNSQSDNDQDNDNSQSDNKQDNDNSQSDNEQDNDNSQSDNEQDNDNSQSDNNQDNDNSQSDNNQDNDNSQSDNNQDNDNNVKYSSTNILKINKSNGKIYSQSGKEIILKGVVLPNVDTVQFTSSINKTTLSALKNTLGVNMIRFTLSPTTKLDFQTAFSRIKTAINNASELGIYVVINWGIMDATVGDPRLTLKENNFNGVVTANKFFETIAEYSKDNPFVLFEICNEPYVKYGESKYENINTWNAVKQYSDIIIPIIRKYTNNIIIVAGKSGVVLTEIVNDPITKYDNIAYTFHLYPYNYKFEVYKSQLESAILRKLPIIATETSIMDAKLSSSRENYDYEKMDQYLKFFKDMKYNLHFAYFKFDFPFETEKYDEWSILKPLNKNYYDTRCSWNQNKNLKLCLQTNTYVRHMSNLDLKTALSSEYFCSSTENKCSKLKGDGVYSISGMYFVNNFMNKK